MTVNTTQTLTQPATNGTPRPEQQNVIAGTRPRPSSSAGEVVMAYLRTQAAALTALEAQVRAGEPDSVHQMRVATRRLRAVLRSFHQVIPAADSGQLAAELQWLGHTLGRARDDEVLTAHLQDRLADRADRAAHRPGPGPRAGSLRAAAGGFGRRAARGARLAAVHRAAGRAGPADPRPGPRAEGRRPGP